MAGTVDRVGATCRERELVMFILSATAAVM